MLTYPWKCTVLHCNHLGNTWKPLVLMTRLFDYCPSASEGDNQSVRSSAPVVSRCFPGGYNVKLYISRGRLAWWLLDFLHSVSGALCSVSGALCKSNHKDYFHPSRGDSSRTWALCYCWSHISPIHWSQMYNEYMSLYMCKHLVLHCSNLKVLKGFQSICKQKCKHCCAAGGISGCICWYLVNLTPNTINAEEYFNMWMRIWVSCV